MSDTAKKSIDILPEATASTGATAPKSGIKNPKTAVKAPQAPGDPKSQKPRTRPKKPSAKAKGKKGPGKKKPRNFLSTGVFTRDRDPKALKESLLYKEGFAVHADTSERGVNPHARAAELRCARHQRGYNKALEFLKVIPDCEHVYACYPTAREHVLSLNDPRVKLYRERLYQNDKIRGLNTYPLPEKKRQAVAVVLDCPMVDLALLFRNLCTPDGELFVVYGGINLAGQLGFDASGWSAEPSTLWKRAEDGSVGSLSLGCITQYRDEPTRQWLDRASGQLTRKVAFEHQPLAKQGVAGFLSQLRIFCGHRSTIDLPFPISANGVLIDESGFVPALFSTNWANTVTHSSTCLTGVEFAVDEHIRCINKKLEYTLKDHPKIYASFRDACTRTVNHLSRLERPVIELLPESRKQLASLESAKERFSTIPGGDILAVLSERSKPFELGRRLIEAIRDIFRRLVQKFKDWKKRTYEDGVPPPETAVVADDGPLTLNVFFSLSKALNKLASKAAESETKAFRRLGHKLHWLAKTLSKPFILIDDSDDELSYFAKFFLTIGSVLIERFVASCAGSISAFIVAAIELFLTAIAEDTVMGAIALAAVKALGHLILALLPFWVALPLHLLIDLSQTGHIMYLLSKIEKTKVGKFILKVVKKIRGSFTNLRRLWYGTSHQGEVYDDQYGNVPLSVIRDDWVVTDDVPKSLKFEGRSISPERSKLFRALDKPARRAIPLLQIEELKNVALTDSSFTSVMLCIQKRYGYVDQAPDGCGKEISDALDFFHEHTVKFRVESWTSDRFLREFRDKGHPKAKIRAYEKAFRDYFGSIDHTDKAVPFGSKTKEILALKVDGAPKIRGIHALPPNSHVPFILEAYGLKDLMRDKFEFFSYMPRFGVFRWTFCRVQKGSSQEIAFRISQVHVNGICVFTAGDDNLLVIRTKNDIWAIELDFKSCDSTMQIGALTSIHNSYRKMGVSEAAIQANLEQCTGKRVVTVRSVDQDRELTFEPDYAYNASGTCFTTQNTDNYSVALWCGVMKAWDEDLNTLLPTIQRVAGKMGIKLAIETYNDTCSNGLTRLGVCTFLSMVPMRAKNADCGFTAVSASFTKKLIVKGWSPSDQGRSVDFGVTTRVGGPLLSTPYGRRINNALTRHSKIHPFDKVKIAKDPTDEYKVQWDSAAIDEEEEFLYLQRRLPGLDYLSYLAEMDDWDTVSEFPFTPEHGTFMIFRAMANAHYGYLADREIRPNG